MKFLIRQLLASEKEFLMEMQYEALFVLPGHPPFSRSVLESPEILKYYDNWGKKGDYAVVAEMNSSKLCGACWIRHFTGEKPGYGFVSERIPELTIALKKENRGKGMGTALMNKIIEYARKMSYEGLSLSVDRRNPAIGLYKKLGFKVVHEVSNPTMLLAF